MHDTFIFDDKSLVKRLQDNKQSTVSGDTVSWGFMYGSLFANLYCCILEPNSYHVNISLHRLSFAFNQYKKIFDTYIDIYTHQIPYIKDLIFQALSKYDEFVLYTCKKNIVNLILHNFWIDSSSNGLKWQIGELNGNTSYSIHGITNIAHVSIKLNIPLYGYIQIGSLLTSSYSKKDLRKYVIYVLINFFNVNSQYTAYLEHKDLFWILKKGL